MFRLTATLVAMTLMRPWRTGWSVDRGVDFSLAWATRPTLPPAATRDGPAAAERACFIDEDWAAPVDAAVARTLAGVAAPERPADETPGLRAWWSLSGKPSRT